MLNCRTIAQQAEFLVPYEGSFPADESRDNAALLQDHYPTFGSSEQALFKERK